MDAVAAWYRYRAFFFYIQMWESYSSTAWFWMMMTLELRTRSLAYERSFITTFGSSCERVYVHFSTRKFETNRRARTICSSSPKTDRLFFVKMPSIDCFRKESGARFVNQLLEVRGENWIFVFAVPRAVATKNAAPSISYNSGNEKNPSTWFIARATSQFSRLVEWKKKKN